MKKIGILLFFLVGVLACIEVDFFGLSSFGDIKSIEVSNQASQAVIDATNKHVS